MSFRAVIVVGNEQGKVGVGVGSAILLHGAAAQNLNVNLPFIPDLLLIAALVRSASRHSS